jgi:NitT/TauT family transport system substrate-binding protein
LKEYNILKPRDLEGQTVGFDVGSGDFQLWPAFIKATGIDDAKVRKVIMDGPALIKALVEKQVKAVGNFYGSIAPSLWAQGLELNSILYADYGIKMLSLVAACKRATIERRPEICRSFIEGLMEGLKYVYLNPDKSAALHLESVKEFKGGGVTNEKVIEYGQAIGTALGMVPAFKEHGLGYMEPGLIEQTAQSVVTYMGVKTLPATASMFTNEFVGTARLTDAEWRSTEERSRKYLPAPA